MILLACKGTESSEVMVSVPVSETEISGNPVITGAEQLQSYVPDLAAKRVGLVVNQSSLVGNQHLLDTLKQLQVNVVRVFTPEHGFRGQADAGAHVDNEVDEKSGLPIISLYGKNRKPKLDDLQDLEVMVFDLQDVGVRCYTYISTLHYVMEACAESGVKLIVLDRPNPNGHYVDGPILQESFKSFIGMHPVPFVHGMTIGEYARMIEGEGWLEVDQKPDLKVVSCANYDHEMRYPLPVAPSPNLPTYRSVLLYPSLVWFEGTTVSVGRGTDHPFEHYGHPDWLWRSYAFTPRSKQGAKYPKHQDVTCLGRSLKEVDDFNIRKDKRIRLDYLIEAYNETKDKEGFFLENGFFHKLAGNDILMQQIKDGKTEEEIRASWSKGLEDFMSIRSKYLLYDEGS
jgi:uncharacterized protein YbbC (DUF1343 family)